MRVRGRSTLDAIVKAAQNGVADGGQLITAEELNDLKAKIERGALSVLRQGASTSLDDFAAALDAMPLLPEERQAAVETVNKLKALGEDHAVHSGFVAELRALWPRVLDRTTHGADAVADVGRALRQRLGGPEALSTREIDAARAGSAEDQAEVLQRLIAPYAAPHLDAATRLGQLEQLMGGLSAAQMGELRDAYLLKFDTDPFLHILGGGLAQPLIAGRLQGSLNLPDLARRFVTSPHDGFENVEEWAVKTYQEIINNPNTGPSSTVQAMATAWLTPELKADTALLSRLLDKVKAGQPLTQEDRRAYFAQMPFIGIRTRSDRPHNVATFEENALNKVWADEGHAGTPAEAMADLEAAFPAPELPTPRPGQKCVAVVVSSQGAQWQELMGYVMEMQRHDVHVQLFTPEGRPAAFRKDSLSVSNTAPLGYGAPSDLDPAGPAGLVARELLGHAAPASAFNVDDFDQVYVAGGLGLNEDGVRVEAKDPDDRKAGRQTGPASTYEAQPDIADMINEAAARQMPVLAICHGPSVFIADNVDLDVSGTHMAALGPFETYVAHTGRTGRPFPHMALVHNDARRAGALVDPVRDALKPSGVVRDVARTASGDDLTLVTGPHPVSAATLGKAGLELLGIQADPAQYLVREDH